MTSAGPGGAYLVGIDIGTQSIRALLADCLGHSIACASRPTPTLRTGPGRAEYAPDSLWSTTVAVLRELAALVPPGGEVAGIACASMGEACVLLDAAGAPLGHAVSWFDRRTEPAAAAFGQRAGADRLFRITGLPVDPTLTLCKLLWHREHDPAQFARVRHVLNLADWIAWRLCGEAATDFSLASRTFCLDMAARDWSPEVLDLAEMPAGLLPPIRPSGTRLGTVRPGILAETGLPGRPVVAVGGHDHVCGGYAAGAGRPGVLLDSMGTAEALFLTVVRPVVTEATRGLGFAQGAIGLHRTGGAQGFAYLGAGLNSSGGSIEWFRSLLGDAENPVPARDRLIAEAAATPVGARGTCFLPHLAYSAPPVVDVAARGAFVGLTAGTSRGAMFRAVLEGLAMEARFAVSAMTGLPGAGRPSEIRVIGGNTKNDLFLRIKANVYGRPITVIGEPEATALGAALLGGLAAGIWPGLDAAQEAIAQDRRTVEPDPACADRYAELYDGIYRKLYPALAPINHDLTRFDAMHAA
jgi:xylulokinase